MPLPQLHARPVKYLNGSAKLEAKEGCGWMVGKNEAALTLGFLPVCP
jgi:hypothetical protein